MVAIDVWQRFENCVFLLVPITHILSFNIVEAQSSTTDDTKKDETFEQEICKDKDAGEWFRLVAGDGDNCRDVIQCTSSVSQSTRDTLEFIK